MTNKELAAHIVDMHTFVNRSLNEAECVLDREDFVNHIAKALTITEAEAFAKAADACHKIGLHHEDAHTRTAELCEDAVRALTTEPERKPTE